jgi:hypothetical protein
VPHRKIIVNIATSADGLIAVIDDGKTNDNPSGAKSVSIAVGRWKAAKTEEPVLAMRWNGDDENPIGNPQSRGPSVRLHRHLARFHGAAVSARC